MNLIRRFLKRYIRPTVLASTVAALCVAIPASTIPTAAAIGVSAVVLTTTGCDASATLAQLTATLGTAAAQVATLEGNTTLANEILADKAAAVVAITNWKPGTASQDVIQAINILIGVLGMIPGVGPYAALIDLALGTAQTIIAILAPSATAQPANLAPRARAVHLANPPKNKKEFTKQWNALCAGNPALAKATI